MIDRITMSRRAAVLGGVAALLSGSVAAARDEEQESWENSDDSIEVKWDPAIWRVDSEAEAAITLVTEPEFNTPRYWLQITRWPQEWTSIADASERAMDDWFSQGMNGSIIFQEYETETSYGWIHYSNFQGNPRTVSVMQYVKTEDNPDWLSVSISIDQAAFDALPVEDALGAIELNGGSVLVMGDDPEQLLKDIESAFAA